MTIPTDKDFSSKKELPTPVTHPPLERSDATGSSSLPSSVPMIDAEIGDQHSAHEDEGNWYEP